MRAWTTAEITHLTQHSHLGAKHLAIELDRSERSIRLKAAELGISLRQPGSRRGILIGQPRGTKWTDQPEVMGRDRLTRIREDILAGKLHLPTILAQIRRQLEQPLDLCPKCTSRAVDRPQTGLCQVCHLRELARGHRDEDDLQDAKRELWRARQERSRANRRQASEHPDAQPDT